MKRMQGVGFCVFYFLRTPHSPSPTLFPYTTLFRSRAMADGGQSIVMVTHDPGAAARADAVVFLRDGRIVDRLVGAGRSEEHTSELQSQSNLVCRLLLEKKK